MSTLPRRPAHLAVHRGDHVQFALGHLVGREPLHLGGTNHGTRAHDAPRRHHRMEDEPEARVEGHRLGVARALDRSRAVRVTVREGQAQQLAPDAVALAARHRPELREHPVVLAHEGL